MQIFGRIWKPNMIEIPLLPASLVGSYAQPSWLINRDRLAERLPPRVLLNDLWQVPAAQLAEAQNDATIIALEDQLGAEQSQALLQEQFYPMRSAQ